MEHLSDSVSKEELEALTKSDLIELEELAKSCPRCGGKSANSGNKAGRCRACLNKLAANKKKPGHYLHNHKVADDALRRQKGKNGTASKKSKGLGTRKEIINKVKTAEKKHGQVLSPDRINNDSGYSSDNVRMVPPKLNRGRHKVDPKKLKAWRDRMKKSDITDELMYVAMLSKATHANNQELLTLLRVLKPNEVMTLIESLESFE